MTGIRQLHKRANRKLLTDFICFIIMVIIIGIIAIGIRKFESKYYNESIPEDTTNYIIIH